MAPPLLDRIRNDGRSEMEAQQVMGRHLEDYYISAEQGLSTAAEAITSEPVNQQYKSLEGADMEKPIKADKNVKDRALPIGESNIPDLLTPPSKRQKSGIILKLTNRKPISTPGGLKVRSLKIRRPHSTSHSNIVALDKIGAGPPAQMFTKKAVKRKAPDDDDVATHEPQPAQKAVKRKAPDAEARAVQDVSQPTKKAIKREILDAQDEGIEGSPEAKGAKGAKEPLDFVGATDYMGSSIEKPENAPNDEPWRCGNRHCNSGQTYFDRDGKNSHGRKVISNFFGRNKKETRRVHPDVWHNFCRKDYQRAKYRADALQSVRESVDYYVEHIRTQLVRLRLWRPDATFRFQLPVGAQKRLNNYRRMVGQLGGDEDAARASVEVQPELKAGGKAKPLSFEQAAPIQALLHFDAKTGDKLSYEELEDILNEVTELGESNSLSAMLPLEFLINEATGRERINDPTTNYQQWIASQDNTSQHESSHDIDDANDQPNENELD